MNKVLIYYSSKILNIVFSYLYAMFVAGITVHDISYDMWYIAFDDFKLLRDGLLAHLVTCSRDILYMI